MSLDAASCLNFLAQKFKSLEIGTYRKFLKLVDAVYVRLDAEVKLNCLRNNFAIYMATVASGGRMEGRGQFIDLY